MTFLLGETFFSFINKNIFFYSWKCIFYKIPKNSFALAFFLSRQILKNIDIPWQNPQHLPIAKANFERCTSDVLFNDIMDLHMWILGTFITEEPFVCFMQFMQGIKFTEVCLTHNVVFSWYFDLISHTQTPGHTGHSRVKR